MQIYDYLGMPELPACAAIRTSTGLIVAGRRHYDCFKSMFDSGLKFIVEDFRLSNQGFMTNRGRFVGRKTAMELMLAAGIPSANKGGDDPEVSPPGFRGDELYSEDLY